MTLSDFNATLHKSSVYNFAQTTIASVAVFTGGMNSGFNKAANSAGVKPSCFVAGTLVMAVAGMVAIETIKSGDKVISTDPESDYQQLLRYVQGSRKLMAGTAVKIYLQQLLYYNSNLYLQPFRLLLRSIRSCKV